MALWSEAMARVVATIREQQRKDEDGPYRFERGNRHATETLMLKSVGAPSRKVRAASSDDPARYSRPWFAWANGLFGDLILDLERRRSALLARPL